MEDVGWKMNDVRWPGRLLIGDRLSLIGLLVGIAAADRGRARYP